MALASRRPHQSVPSRFTWPTRQVEPGSNVCPLSSYTYGQLVPLEPAPGMDFAAANCLPIYQLTLSLTTLTIIYVSVFQAGIWW